MKTLVEHSFVTTDDWTACAAVMDRLLTATGMECTFSCLNCGASGHGIDLSSLPSICSECREPRLTVYSNGNIPDHLHTRVENLPRWVMVEFDRGRVEVAAAITSKARSRRHHEPLLLFATKSLEAVLTGRTSVDSATTRFRALVRRSNTDVLNARRRVAQIALGVGGILILSTIAFVLYLTSRG